MGLAEDAASVGRDAGRFNRLGQGIKTAGRPVGRLVSIAVQQEHDAAEHAADLVKGISVLRAAGDDGRVAESSGDGEFGGVGVIEEGAAGFLFDRSLSPGVPFDVFAGKAEISRCLPPGREPATADGPGRAR